MRRILSIFIMILSLSFAFTLTACDKEDPLSGVTFSDKSFDYDGKTHSIAVENLPEGYTVEYQFNDQKEAGTYKVIATIKDTNGKVAKTIVAKLIIVGEPKHDHEYTGAYKSDDSKHWQECSCGKAGTKEAHKGGTATQTEKAKCEVCGASYGELAQPPHTHVFDSYGTNGTHHWEKCACGEEGEIAAHTGGTATAEKQAECEVCGRAYGELAEDKTPEHTCDFTAITNYESSETEHWKKCSCGEISVKEAHTGGTATTEKQAECEVCGALYGNLAEESGGDTETEGYVVEVSGATYPLSENPEFNPNKEGETAEAEYMSLGLNVTQGDTLVVTLDGVEITKIGPSSAESNVDEEMKVVSTATDVAIYVKLYSDGGYSVWLEGKTANNPSGDQGGTDDNPIEDYVVEVSGATYPLSENLEFNPNKEGETAISEYMATGLSVIAGEKLVVTLGGVEITKIGPSSAESNVDVEMKVVSTATDVAIYVKLYTDGGYSVWLEGKAPNNPGGDTQDPINSQGYELRGTMTNWGHSDSYLFEEHDEDEVKITVTLEASAQFKVVQQNEASNNEVWWHGYGCVKDECRSLATDVNGNIAIKEAGTYTLYWDKDDFKLWIEKVQ